MHALVLGVHEHPEEVPKTEKHFGSATETDNMTLIPLVPLSHC